MVKIYKIILFKLALRFKAWKWLIEKSSREESNYPKAAAEVIQLICRQKDEYEAAYSLMEFVKWIVGNSPIPVKPWLAEEVDKYRDLLGYGYYVEIREETGNPVSDDMLEIMAHEMYVKESYLISAYLFALAGSAEKARAAFNLHRGPALYLQIRRVQNMITRLESDEVIDKHF